MKKSLRFGLVLTQAERRALARLAEVEGGLSHAATLRRLIRQAARQHGLWPLPGSGDREPANRKMGGEP